MGSRRGKLNPESMGNGKQGADKAEEGQARCWQQQAEESESREGATVAAAGAGTEGKSGEGGEESRGKICAAEGIAVDEQGRHGQYREANTTEAEASAGVGMENYDLAAATKGEGR